MITNAVNELTGTVGNGDLTLALLKIVGAVGKNEKTYAYDMVWETTSVSIGDDGKLTFTIVKKAKKGKKS